MTEDKLLEAEMRLVEARVTAEVYRGLKMALSNLEDGAWDAFNRAYQRVIELRKETKK